MLERIEIGIIPHDLRHEETIVQIAEALDNLDVAASHIFECIDKRLSENNLRLSNVKKRASNLQNHLNYLQTNLNLKAIKIYSAAKYPAANTYREYKTILSPWRKKMHMPKSYKSRVPIADVPESISFSNMRTEDGQYIAKTSLQEKLQFYYVKSKSIQKTIFGDIEEYSLPIKPSSISSFLLFDNVHTPREQSTITCQDNKEEIEDAPDSIQQPWNSSESDLSNYLYTPTLGEVPQIIVPLVLPDLPGIVDDEKFTLDLSTQSPIAPSSAVTTPTVHLDLPVPLDVNIDSFNEFSLNSETTSQKESSRSVDDENPKTAPPPPPPPSLPSPPPPPPPPPPVPPKDESTVKIEEKKSIPSPVIDDRSNLMAAIRNAGGIGRAKLKHTATGDKKDDRWASASVGRDLMADLHATLALRRKGIAGSNAGALERMANLIPPPPKPNEMNTSDRNSATSEYDSQPDTDDWEE